MVGFFEQLAEAMPRLAPPASWSTRSPRTSLDGSREHKDEVMGDDAETAILAGGCFWACRS
jgi:hypothetical protein